MTGSRRALLHGGGPVSSKRWLVVPRSLLKLAAEPLPGKLQDPGRAGQQIGWIIAQLAAAIARGNRAAKQRARRGLRDNLFPSGLAG